MLVEYLPASGPGHLHGSLAIGEDRLGGNVIRRLETGLIERLQVEEKLGGLDEVWIGQLASTGTQLIESLRPHDR